MTNTTRPAERPQQTSRVQCDSIASDDILAGDISTQTFRFPNFEKVCL